LALLGFSLWNPAAALGAIIMSVVRRVSRNPLAFFAVPFPVALHDLGLFWASSIALASSTVQVHRAFSITSIEKSSALLK